jgi:uncharacterized membrane protein YtjA (UPF0391 family)
VRGLATALLIIAIVAGTLGAGGIGYSLFGDASLFIPSLALLVVPWAIFIPVRRLATAQGKAPFQAALNGVEPDTANWYDGSGLALDRTNGKLVIADRGDVAVHAVNDLTDVEYVPESAAPLFPSRRGASGPQGSGLFLTLGERKWQVSGIDVEEARLWIEALRQVAPQARFREAT